MGSFPRTSGGVWGRSRSAPPDIPPLRIRLHAVTGRAQAPEERLLDRPLALGTGAGNDFVLRGPELLERHASLVPTERGPWLALAPGALARVNGRLVADGIGLRPGDDVELGSQRLLLVPEHSPAMVHEWRLLSADQRASVLVAQPLEIGSDPACQLRIAEPHVASRHALLIPDGGLLWVQDPTDAGTYLNGEVIRGARLLSDGDRLQVGADEFHVAGTRRDAASAPAAEADVPPPPQPMSGEERPAAGELPAAGRRQERLPVQQIVRPRAGHHQRRPRRLSRFAVVLLMVTIPGAFVAGLTAGLSLDGEQVNARIEQMAERLQQLPDWIAGRLESITRSVAPAGIARLEPAPRSASLDGAEPAARRPVPNASVSTAPPVADPDAAVAARLAAAREHLHADPLAPPAAENALELALQVLTRNPQHADAIRLLNEAIDRQLERAKRLMMEQDFERAASLLRPLEQRGLNEAADHAALAWLEPEQQRDLRLIALIIEADRFLQRGLTAAQRGDDPGPRLRATVAASPDAELTPRVIADIGDILALAAREARWAGRDREARLLQDLQQRLSSQAGART
jgi:hypothetical protein